MRCPQCKNKGFIPTDDVARPLHNLGGKEKFAGFDLRRYVCMQCGHRFLTVEKYHRDIQVQTRVFEGQS